MTRILSSIFYMSSMRKTSEEFNSDTAVENIWFLCGEEPAEELPYWETINRYLRGLDPEMLQGIVCRLCRRPLCRRAFEGARIRGKYWQIIIDGTQLYSSRGELDKKSLYRVHNRGTKEEYRENYYYVLEAEEKKWKYIVRFKEGSIPYIEEEYWSLRKREKNLREKVLKDGKVRYDYVEGIDYNGYPINVVEYAESREVSYQKGKKKNISF